MADLQRMAPLLALLFTILSMDLAATSHTDTNTHPHDASTTSPRPNIMFIMADNIGFNDLGLNDCSTTTTNTPFLDTLIVQESLYLNAHYVPKGDSPSRAAFLTGRYPMNIGMYDIDEFEVEYPYSLTRQVSTISEEFKTAGYSTHMIGYKLSMRLPVSKLSSFVY